MAGLARAAARALPLVLFAFLSISPNCAWAQLRIYGHVDPNAGNPLKKLVFDINSSTDDNISPNIVLTRDGKYGYVAYTGSGAILGFSLETGEVTDRIETGGKPYAATLHPDGHTASVVSAFENKVFIVDIEGRRLVTTYSFDKALFGFGSVVSLSPDGAVGYISSTDTGEVIKFQISDGKELGRLSGMQAPCQITVSLDGSTLMVVDTLAEELVFADAAGLTKKTGLRGPTDRYMNFTLFNKPVLAPDGRTGIIASRDVNGILGSDTVILFSTDTGKLLETASIGNEPGFTGLTPDGKSWVIFNELTLSVISTTNFSSRKELNLVRGESIGSANIVFSPDSRYAYYASSSSDEVFQHDLQADVVVAQILVGTDPETANEQASSLAITSDGGFLAVAKFKTDKLDLLAGAVNFDTAKLISSPDRFTGVNLLNLAPVDNEFTLTALDIYGQKIAGEGITNPSRINLPRNNQVSLTAAQIFNLDSTKETIGWLRVSAVRPEAVGYVSIGDNSLNRLDAVPLFSKYISEWVAPDVIKAEGQTAELNLVNPNYTQTNYDATYYQPDGNPAEQRLSNIAYPTNRHAQAFHDFFANAPADATGYVRYKSAAGLIFTEWVEKSNSIAAINGIEIARFAGVTTLYSPQFAVTSGFTTILNLINAGEADADVTVTLHRADGSVIGQPVVKFLPKNNQLKEDLAVLFQDYADVADVTGWVEVLTTSDRVVGTVTFTNADDTFRTTFELSGAPSGKLLFPVVAQDDTYQTGIALLNANPEAAAVTIELWGPGGTLDRTTGIRLQANSRTALYLNGLFPNMTPMLVGNIRVRSDRPLHGMALIHDRDFNFMTAVPAGPLP